MKEKWTGKEFLLTIGFSVIYFIITMVVMMTGSFTPLTWIFMTAVIGLLAGIPYMYITAREQKMGVPMIMNLIVGIVYFAAGELSDLLLVTLVITAVAAEIIRKVGGYDRLKSNQLSYIVFVFGMFGSPLYIWAFREYTIGSAVKEMSEPYAAQMEAMTPPWMLAVVIVATLCFAVMGTLIAKGVLKKTNKKFMCKQ